MTCEHAATQSTAMLSTLAQTVVAIPAYNEDRFIGSVVLKARAFAQTVMVVDDGSRDQTAAVAEAAGAVVLRHAVNRGKGAAVNTALCAAAGLNAAVVILLDGDGQHHPADIPTVAQPILDGQADIVVGSRFLTCQSRIPGWRQVGQHALTAMTNVLSRQHLTDSQSGFRALSRRALLELHLGECGFSIESEMQFKARALGLRVAEVPIGVTYAERSKRNPVLHGVQVVSGIVRLVGQTRPLLFFGAPGLLALCLGLGLGFWVIERFEATRQLAMGSALVTAIFIIVGTLAVFNGLALHSIRAMLVLHDEHKAG